jgi:hypothetical protein
MENKRIYLSIYIRIIMIIMDLFLLYGLLFFFINNNENINVILFVFGIMFIIFLPLTILIFVSYVFSNNKVIVKYPFIKEKECLTEDIIGYILQETSEDTNLRIYTNNIIISIIVFGKNIRSTVNEFMNKYYQIIKNKNLEELNNNGIRIHILKRKQIHFYLNYLEIIKKGYTEKYFYKDLKAKYLYNNVIKFVTQNNKKIWFNIWQCKGRFGLFEYLKNYKYYYK